MPSFKNFLIETINEKYKFKSVFIIGIPASGKSTLVTPLRRYANIIDTDDPTEMFGKKLNVPLTGDEDVTGYRDLRKIVKLTTKNKLASMIDNMAPIIATMVGDNIDRSKARMKVLQDVGYEVGMIFMNSDLFVSKQRAAQRSQSSQSKYRASRVVPEEYIDEAYLKLLDTTNLYAQHIIPGLRRQLEFFVQLDMDPYGNYPQAQIRRALGKVDTFFNRPVNTEIANNILNEIRNKPRAMLSHSSLFSREDINHLAAHWFSGSLAFGQIDLSDSKSDSAS